MIWRPIISSREYPSIFAIRSFTKVVRKSAVHRPDSLIGGFDKTPVTLLAYLEPHLLLGNLIELLAEFFFSSSDRLVRTP